MKEIYKDKLLKQHRNKKSYLNIEKIKSEYLKGKREEENRDIDIVIRDLDFISVL